MGGERKGAEQRKIYSSIKSIKKVRSTFLLPLGYQDRQHFGVKAWGEKCFKQLEPGKQKV